MRLTRVVQVLLLVGCILLAVVNYSIFHHVKSNQQGQPNARLWLTERELPLLKNPISEDTSLRLGLHWRVLGDEAAEDRHGTPFWLTGEKLQQLGFPIDSLPADRQSKRLYREKRPVYIVFEQNGPTFKKAVHQAAQLYEREDGAVKQHPNDKSLRASRLAALKRLQAEEVSLPRLFAVDAGVNPAELKELYSNSSQYFILPGIVQLHVREENNRVMVSGFIDSINLPSVHVPVQFSSAIKALIARHQQSTRQPQPPRYAVLLAWGHHLEPWIDAVGPVAD